MSARQQSKRARFATYRRSLRRTRSLILGAPYLSLASMSRLVRDSHRACTPRGVERAAEDFARPYRTFDTSDS